MRVDVLSLFPEAMQPYLEASILGRARRAGLLETHLHQLRQYSRDPHQKVDDRPFGGGPGMILMCQPVVDAVKAIEPLDSRPALRVLFTPQGRLLNQSLVRELLAYPRLLLICGHYEGYDERIVDELEPLEISIGDYILTGGELPALVLIDSVARLVPGVLGNESGPANESFEDSSLEFPQYTRPREYAGRRVPDVLISGNHAEIARWRAEQAARRTQRRRPDLRSKSCSTPAGVASGEVRRASGTYVPVRTGSIRHLAESEAVA